MAATSTLRREQGRESGRSWAYLGARKARAARSSQGAALQRKGFVVKNGFIDEFPRQPSEGSNTRSRSAPAPTRLRANKDTFIKFMVSGVFTQDDLTRSFHKQGSVVTADYLVRNSAGESMGYGFVTIVCEDEDLDGVLQAMRGAGVQVEVTLKQDTFKFKFTGPKRGEAGFLDTPEPVTRLLTEKGLAMTGDPQLVYDEHRGGKSRGWGFVDIVCEHPDRVLQAMEGAGVKVEVALKSIRDENPGQ